MAAIPAKAERTGEHTWEVACPNCGQSNTRYTGLRALLNPRWPWRCTICAADLETGQRGLIDRIHGAIMFAIIYFYYVVAGAGAVVLVMAVAALITANLGTEWPAALRPIFYAVPLIAGVAFAEWHRRRKTLVSGRANKVRVL